MSKQFLSSIILCLFTCTPALAANTATPSAPWGGASLTPTVYKPQKVVYDVHLKTIDAVSSVLDRASHISKITGANPFEQSIVLVLHGAEIKFFARKNYAEYKALMHRAQSLVLGEVLTIKMCEIAARSKGFQAEDIHGFVEMVPMGDAEIVRLQNDEGHAYMR